MAEFFVRWLVLILRRCESCQKLTESFRLEKITEIIKSNNPPQNELLRAVFQSSELRFRQQHPLKSDLCSSKTQVRTGLSLADLLEDGEGLLLVVMTPVVLWNIHTSTQDVCKRNNNGWKRLKKQNSLKITQGTWSPPRARAKSWDDSSHRGSLLIWM